LTVKTKNACSILIVEDDQHVRSALVQFLGHVGHQVVAAETVAEGLAKLDGQACAILDLNLADGVGTTILERIRSDKPAMKVAIASGSGDEALLEDAKRLRPDLLLRKPYNVNELLDWLDSVG
jgi:CheY-like chemotaxis protein